MPGGTARALDPGRAPTQYAHTPWTSRHGLPGEAVYDVLQTPGGYLWLRTSAGLVRFDGACFARVEPVVDGEPVRDTARAVCRGADGDLLVRGLTTTLRYRAGAFSHRLPPAPLEKGNLRVLFEASDRQLWVGGDAYVHKARHGGFDTVLDGTGWIFAFLEDRRGDLWVGGAYGLYRHRGGRFAGPAPEVPVKDVGHRPRGGPARERLGRDPRRAAPAGRRKGRGRPGRRAGPPAEDHRRPRRPGRQPLGGD